MKKYEFILEDALAILPDFYELLKTNKVITFDAFWNLSSGELFKKNRYRSVVRVFLKDTDGKSHIFHLKKHHPPFLARCKSLFTGFRILDGGENEWSKLLRLEEIGISTMTPVAFGTIRKWGLPYRALTVTEHLYGAEKLEDYLPAIFGDRVTLPGLVSYKRKIMTGTALWARKFHGSGFHHQDFYLGHIFIKPEKGDDFTLHMIDLQRVREPRVLRKSRVIKDLAQINYSAMQVACITQADRLRFIKAYLQLNRLDKSAKKLILMILAKTERIAAHDKKIVASKSRRSREQNHSQDMDKKKIKESL